MLRVIVACALLALTAANEAPAPGFRPARGASAVEADEANARPDP